jgi:hypothetical protein
LCTCQAFASIGWKYYLIFIILSVISVVWVYFYLPETKGIPLEEMGRLFGDEVAVYQADIHSVPKTDELMVEHHDGTHGTGIFEEVHLGVAGSWEMSLPATKDIEIGRATQTEELEYADKSK